MDCSYLVWPCQIWSDGHKYAIDRITQIVPAAAQKAGGCGDRYTVFVEGKQIYLFFERTSELLGNNIDRWFVERLPGKSIIPAAYSRCV